MRRPFALPAVLALLAAASKQLRADVRAQKAALETGTRRLMDDPACLEAFRHVPKRAAEDATGPIFQYSFEALVAPIAPAFVERLDAVELRDRRLRGRGAQRRTEWAVRLVQPPPADICARLDAWRRAGYPANGASRIFKGIETDVEIPLGEASP